MYKTILVIICASLVSFTLTGCFGLAVTSPVECKNETPFTGVHDIFYLPAANKERLPKTAAKMLDSIGLLGQTPKASTKADFLKEWGEPDKIISTSEDQQTWIYERHLWCGVIPMVFIPIPLVLPVCDGFDKIYFMGNEAKLLHTRHSSTGGFFIVMSPAGGASGGGSDPACRYPLPFGVPNSIDDKISPNGPLTSVPTYSLGDKIPDNAGLVIFYRPRHFVGSGGIHSVHVRDNLIIPLYDGSYYPYLSPLGENEFWMQAFFSKKAIKINVVQGQTYYFRFGLGFFTFDFEEIAAEIAEKEIAELKVTPNHGVLRINPQTP